MAGSASCTKGKDSLYCFLTSIFSSYPPKLLVFGQNSFIQAFNLRKTRNKILAAFLSSKDSGVKLITHRGLALAKHLCAKFGANRK